MNLHVIPVILNIPSSSTRTQDLGPKLISCAAAVVGRGPGLMLQQVPSCRIKISLTPFLDQGSCCLCSTGRSRGSCQQLPLWITSGKGKSGPVSHVLPSLKDLSCDDRKEAENTLLSKALNALYKVIHAFCVLHTFSDFLLCQAFAQCTIHYINMLCIYTSFAAEHINL